VSYDQNGAQGRVREEELTAYVMNELDRSAKERVEAALAKDPALRAEAEAIRALCGSLWETLKAEPMPAVDLTRRRAMKEQMGKTGQAAPAAKKKPRSGSLVVGFMSLAAAAMVGLLVYPRLAKKGGDGSLIPGLVGDKGSRKAGDAEEVRFVAAEPEKDAAPATEQKKEDARSQAVLSQSPKDKTIAAAKPVPGPSQPATPMPLKRDVAKNGLSLADSVSSGGVRAKVAAPSGAMLSGTSAQFGSGAGGMGRLAERRGGMTMDEGEDGIEHNTEAYDLIRDNPFKSPVDDPLSTFSSDVDTASYANVRRFLDQGQLPPKDAVRIEELVNYFPYAYAAPKDDRPFAVDVEVAQAPWAKDHRLVRIGIKGEEIEWGKRPASNLVFLLDVSGSMEAANKLPLVRESLKLLVDYAGASGLVLPSTSAAEKQDIVDALDKLHAGGSTNGGAGIELAYKTAEENFIKDGINRVMIATDGDFNVGTTGEGDLVRLIERKAKSGVFLSVLGYGMGNIKDSTLEKLADKGNGHYAYIDSETEAKKVLVEQAGGTMQTIAKDVKLQVEFNPAEVNAYRLIGYENRVLAHQDFNDDKKDAGDIGAGHTVTALYEVVPKGVAFKVQGVDPLKYQKPQAGAGKASGGELMTVKLRYKEPKASKSSLVEYAVKDKGRSLESASDDFRFAAAVAEFGMLLRDSEHKGKASWADVTELASTSLGGGKDEDKGGYRQEFVELVRKAQRLSGGSGGRK
jgi:Ca-activated chloride channel family protein